ncbi:Ubiquitin carboxyl-terminal hydrolase 2 [Aix galericulata]|nr:Ubiquitin carboxyl-terminal hydrolase 2 [Aix galericulata]
MSQLSSTLKRYGDSSRYAETTYGRVPGAYSSYTSYGSSLTTAYADSDKIGFKASYLPSPRYHHSGLSPTSAYDGRLPLYPDSGIRLSPAYLRTQPRPPGGGLSGGSCYTFPGTPGSPSGYLPSSAPLSRGKSVSHSDLVQEFAGLRASESAYASSPGARGRQELGALQGLYQAAAHSDYVRDYLESCGRKSSHCSFPCSPPGPSRAALSSAGTHGASQPCERSDGYGGASAPETLVSGAPWRGGTGRPIVGSRVLCGFVLSWGG